MAHAEKYIYNLLQQIALEQKYLDFNIKLTEVTSGGANYTSRLYLANITSSGFKDLRLFVKVAAFGEKMREQMKTSIYDVESYMYTDMKKAFREIEEKYKVPVQHKMNFPEYYGASLTRMEELLVLEDLTASGYGNHDRLQSINWPYASAAVAELAKYHALSVAFQKYYPHQFKYFSEHMTISKYSEETFKILVSPGLGSALFVVRAENRWKLKRFYDKLDYAAYSNYNTPMKTKFILHGDFRPSNMMHKILDDRSVEVVPVDFQTPGLGCPVIDLLYLIFSGTDKNFRDRYYDRLIEHYYTRLRDQMQMIGLNPEVIYTREDYNYELKVNLPYGLIMAVVALPFITVDPENAPQIGGDMADLHVSTLGATYSGRMNDIIDDFVKWGVLTDAQD